MIHPIGRLKVAMDVAMARSSSANHVLTNLLTPLVKNGYPLAPMNWAISKRVKLSKERIAKYLIHTAKI
jgi:hypothetical protein